MAVLDFPDNPQEGDVFEGWTWDGEKWIPVEADDGGGIPDAVHDGTLYGRKDGEWEPVPEPPALPAQPVAFSFFIPGKPPDNQPYFVSIVFPCSIAASSTESKGHVRTNPTATLPFELAKIAGGVGAGQRIGLVYIYTSGVVTITTDATELEPGDVLGLVPLSGQDATLADVSISILARRPEAPAARAIQKEPRAARPARPKLVSGGSGGRAPRKPKK